MADACVLTEGLSKHRVNTHEDLRQKCQISGGAKTDEARRREYGGGVRQAEDPQGGAGNWGTGSDVIDSIPGNPISGNPIPGVPMLARIHYNLPYMKY